MASPSAGHFSCVEPLPEIRAAADRLSALIDGVDLLAALDAMATVAVDIVPSCVGLSVTVVLDGEPFTLTATSPHIATLDAAQYLDGGPCVDAGAQGHDVSIPDAAASDVLDERRWQLYGQAAAAVGVRSSLSLPLRRGARQVPGSINLYASQIDAFAGREELLAEVFGVSVDDLVRNADLPFGTRELARALPQQVEDRARVDQAVSMLTLTRGWDPKQAMSRLQRAAAHAGAPVGKVADALLELGDA